MGAWIEITDSGGGDYPSTESHPLWVRGLKSLPDISPTYWGWVAPFMGAWIEIPAEWGNLSTSSGRTLYGCVDWNQENLLVWLTQDYVAPFMGAWIEM